MGVGVAAVGESQWPEQARQAGRYVRIFAVTGQGTDRKTWRKRAGLVSREKQAARKEKLAD